MKTPLAEAAKKLNLHPLQFVMVLAPLSSSFTEVWPSIEEGLVPTLQQLMQGPITGSAIQEIAEKLDASRTKNPLMDLDVMEVQCLQKLKRKNFWGKRVISEDALRKNYLRGAKDAGASIDKMIKLELLLQHKHHTYALNPHAEATIEGIISD